MVSNLEHFREVNPDTKRAGWMTQRLVQPGKRLVLINAVNMPSFGNGNIQPHGLVIECSSDDRKTLIGVTPLSNVVSGIMSDGEKLHMIKSVDLVRITGELVLGQSKLLDFVPEDADPHSHVIPTRITHE